jgi:hypothetical protein
MSRILGVAVVAFMATTTAWADRPIRTYVPVHLDPAKVPTVVNSHTLFLNRCRNNCTLHAGSSDSRTDTSDILTQTGRTSATLTAYPYGDNTWNSVVTCVKGLMSAYNITVTDVDPGMADHFEVMVAGSPGQMGLSGNVGGIADYACQEAGVCSPYQPDALVFDFTDVWGGSVTEDCATIAQEIAHSWTLDHCTLNNDPMTYNPLAPPLSYHDNAPCGSDCVNGQSPFGYQCTGQNHVCMSTNTSTQNENQIIMKLFGPHNAATPVVKITSPADGSAQQAGFQVQATCTVSDGSGVQQVDLSIDGVPKVSSTTAPYNFTTDPTLKDGSHKIGVTCSSNNQASATATISVVIGQKCSGDSQCPMNDICYESACIAGPMAAGGIGTTCTGNAQCASGTCGSDGTMSVCVVPCDLTNDHCPSGFGCQQAGTGGVCWPGAARGPTTDPGGCCDAGGPPAGPLLLGLGFAATLVMRRRRPNLGGQS